MGGAEKILTIIANYLDSNGHDISIMSISKNEPFFMLNKTIKYIQLGEGKNIVLLITSLKKAIVSSNPEIVISFMSEMNILSILASKLARKPIIVSERSAFDFLDIKPFWKKLRRVVYPFSDALIVLTEEDKRRYSFVRNTYKIENPLVLNKKHLNIKREKIILGVGRLNQVKGFDMLIKSFAKANREGWKLLIVGEGKERNSLEKLIKSLNLLKKVELVGMVEAVEQYYKKASIFILSSRTEGFTGVLCEAMGYGCAVISFDCPSAPREIISHEADGLLVTAENIENLSYELGRLIDNPIKRENLSKNSKKISNRLAIDKIANRWLDVAKDILEIR